MSDERKGLSKKKLLEWLDVWFKFYSTEYIPQLRAVSPKKVNEIYPHKEQAYKQIISLIQQQPEMEDMKKYVEEKARELCGVSKYNLDEATFRITQIIKDARGGQNER